MPRISATVIFLLSCMLASSLTAETRILSKRFDDWFYRCVEIEKEKDGIRCEVVQIAQTKQDEKTINLLTLSLSEKKDGKKTNTVLTESRQIGLCFCRGHRTISFLSFGSNACLKIPRFRPSQRMRPPGSSLRDGRS